jgi:hypothetical protein
MRTTITLSLAALAGSFVLSATACEPPSVVTIPDGKSASREQMLEAQSAVKGYMSAMDQYLKCVDDEMNAKGEEAPNEYKALMVQRHNSAVAEMESVAGAFNEQRKAYLAANPAPAK